MVKNDAGQIAVKCYRSRYINVSGGGEYVFVTRANIPLAWINEADLDKVLAIKGGCCGGKKPIMFLASETDVRRWTNNGGR